MFFFAYVRACTSCCRHPGCECPDGYSGDHCEIMETTGALSEIVHVATSKKTGGAIAAIVIGTLCAVGLVYYTKERFVDKPRRERARLNAMTPGARAQAELATKSNRRSNRTRPIV